MRPCRAVHRAFTLIEILVAIVILGLLAAIGFQAVSAARESARQTRCVSHLRQIFQAITMYMDDYGGDPVYSLPPSLAVLEPQYVKDRRVLVCANIPRAESTKVGGLGYLYQVGFTGFGEGDYELWPSVYARRGNDSPILVDPWHGAYHADGSLNLVDPLWFVLRIDGRVERVRGLPQSSVDL